MRFGAGADSGEEYGAAIGFAQKYGKQMYVKWALRVPPGPAAARSGWKNVESPRRCRYGAVRPLVPGRLRRRNPECHAACRSSFWIWLVFRLVVRWLAGLRSPTRFHNVGSNWVVGNGDANMEAEALSKLYDGLIFVEESHAAQAIEN